MGIKKNDPFQTYQNQAQAAVSFLKKCYEIGNKPVWKPLTAREKAALKKRKRDALKAENPQELNKPQGTLICGEITNQSGQKFWIGDQVFSVNEDTWVIGILKLGAIAEVTGRIDINSVVIAKKATILK